MSAVRIPRMAGLVNAFLVEEDDGLTPQPWDDEPWWHLRWLPWAEGATGSVQAVDLRAGGPGQGRLGRAGHSGGADLTDSS